MKISEVGKRGKSDNKNTVVMLVAMISIVSKITMSVAEIMIT